jgi:hypothetical protein
VPKRRVRYRDEPLLPQRTKDSGDLRLMDVQFVGNHPWAFRTLGQGVEDAGLEGLQPSAPLHCSPLVVGDLLRGSERAQAAPDGTLQRRELRPVQSVQAKLQAGESAASLDVEREVSRGGDLTADGTEPIHERDTVITVRRCLRHFDENRLESRTIAVLRIDVRTGETDSTWRCSTVLMLPSEGNSGRNGSSSLPSSPPTIAAPVPSRCRQLKRAVSSGLGGGVIPRTRQ